MRMTCAWHLRVWRWYMLDLAGTTTTVPPGRVFSKRSTLSNVYSRHPTCRFPTISALTAPITHMSDSPPAPPPMPMLLHQFPHCAVVYPLGAYLRGPAGGTCIEGGNMHHAGCFFAVFFCAFFCKESVKMHDDLEHFF